MRYTIQFTITEKHLAGILSILSNALFFIFVVFLFTNKDFISRYIAPEQKIKVVLNSAPKKFKVKRFQRVIPMPQMASKKVSRRDYSFDDLLKMVKKKKLTNLERKIVDKTKSLDQLKKNMLAKNVDLSKLKSFSAGAVSMDNLGNVNDDLSSVRGMTSKDVNELKRIIADHDIYFKRCYEESLLMDPGLKGLAGLGLQVGNGGSVSSVNVDFKGESKAAQNVRSCLSTQAKKIQIPSKYMGLYLKFRLYLQS